MSNAAHMTSELSVQPFPALELESRHGLEQAFSLFNQMSAQLTDSYGLLEARVTELKGELAQAGVQRLQELAEKERLANRLQNLLDLLPGGVIVIDGMGVVREANPAAIDLLGQPLLGMLWRHVISRCFAPREDDGHEISLKDGRRLSISTRSLDAEPGQLVLLNDLTETRRLQEQLARHERLSSLGRMVASLAHQIRTPLSAAMIYASHLTEQELPVETQQRFAGRLKERLHELEHQVRDMLVFARGELPLTDRIAPGALFQALQNAAATHLQGVAVRWQCDSVDGELLCNRDTLVGALLNLVENAVQAST
ncbi:histidine kinase dimerization/phospho-acceptor domain-containing protein, partial [Pseudomonas viridiflava]